VIDVGCGCGGDTVGFARGGATVIAIERDATRLAMARHNAGVYGVSGRIRFVAGDGVALLATLPGDLVFVDPPWGRDASKERTGLDDLPLLAAVLADPREVWAKVPASFDPTTVAGATATAVFGLAEGDRRRVKFTIVKRPARGPNEVS
jgi:trimethylguanosine synthase